MSWLVTGGAGYIGGHVVREMVEAGHRVVVFDDLSTGDVRSVPAGVLLVHACVTDTALLRRAMDEHGVHAVMHLAARKSVGESVRDPIRYYRQNVAGTLAVVEAMTRTGVRRIVLASSAAVYGSPEVERVDEDTPTDPVNPYGKTKLACEWIVRDAAAAYGVHQVCLRYFNVAGTLGAGLRDRGGAGLIPRALAAVAAGTPPSVLGGDYPTPDGSCVRDFVHVADVAAAHRLVAEALERGRCEPVYNIGSGTGLSVLEVLDTVRSVTGTAFESRTVARRHGDPARVIASVDRIRSGLGWTARRSVADMVRDDWAARTGPGDHPVPVPVPAGPGQRPTLRVVPAPAGHPDQAAQVGCGRVVVISASVGAGHDGAAREWARRLGEEGFESEIHDLLELLPTVLGRGMREVYRAMLERAPWSYTAIHRLAGLPGGRAVVGWLFAPYRSRLRRLLPADTVAVLSTYPVASQLLGTLRRRGEVTVPVVTFLTDFSVHRLWVAPGVDAHCAVHEVSAEQARALGAAGVRVTGPVVAGHFGPGSAEARRRARERFGLPAGNTLALLVAGSWGVGDVERTAAEIAGTGVAVPVIVCGGNTLLLERLRTLGLGHPLGWVDDMPDLLKAVDVLVENAGGLTSLEAMASGLPVATYRPIPGHGRTNAAALDRAGVSAWIRGRDELAGTLSELVRGPRGRRQREESLAMVAAASTGPLLDAFAARDTAAPARPHAVRRRRLLPVAAVAMLLLALDATVGARLAVAHGLQSIRPGGRDATYLVVHPGPELPLDATTIRLLVSAKAAVAVDEQLVRGRPEQVRAMAAAGLTLVNAGSGPPYETGIVGGRSVISRNAAAIDRLSGRHPAFYLSGPDIDAVDVGTVSYLREVIVRPTVALSCGSPPTVLPPLRGRIVLVEGAAQPGCDLALTLTRLRRQASDQTIRMGSLTELQS